MTSTLEKLKELGWGPVRLSKAITRLDEERKLTSQAISQWEKVPAGRVLQVEAVTGLSRHDLRPDIFGEAA
jgi:DNA-binding transcriptional regulator YdaS (Cro superfamily)